MSSYPVPPPTYTTPQLKPYTDETPLIDVESASEASPLLVSGSIANQIEVNGIPDDFKYGTTVSDSAPQIRKAFVRKVYSILMIQIFATIIIAGTVSQSSQAIDWVMNHLWALFVPAILALVNLILLQWKRHLHPLNLVLLSTFTLLEAYVVGIAVAHYDNQIILQALGITLAVFLALTVFTFQSKYDFAGWGPFLLSAIIVFITTSFVHLLVAPFTHTTDVVITVCGCLVFSAFIVYDTYNVNKRLSPDEFIAGAVSLYLDFLNLFLRILRLQ
ncbi:hypothetical protein MIND_00175100 [Mycena indigotica]|uniref:Uncharacterized protein n=1 Tax=Mycena indigotica TaxID=2126181 RepID=A0A8H6TDE7_9AGAR|nr:uncharacterized protein MIND_00175100 [Mycena indigotica]KAF7316558.1 hypothetical protein MIND_00175100 [Mycena indigotica]